MKTQGVNVGKFLNYDFVCGIEIAHVGTFTINITVILPYYRIWL